VGADRRGELLAACLNSFVFDYVARLKVGGIHLNFFIAYQLPVIPPDRLECKPIWDSTTEDWWGPRLLELSYTSFDMTPFAEDLGDQGAPFVWDPARRETLRAELDAAFFHLYGVSRVDIDYILDSFPIIRRKDEERWGEYQTKRLILEIYDAMQKAIDTGTPYQTVLDPPPGQGPRHQERKES
jgi:hypothetical protein